MLFHMCYSLLHVMHIQAARPLVRTPNPPTNIVDFRVFDSSPILISRGGIPMLTGISLGFPRKV